MWTEEMESRFVYHAPKPGQPEVYVLIRDTAKEFARLVVESCPAGREQSLALTKIEEAVFWANASIARSKGEVSNAG